MKLRHIYITEEGEPMGNPEMEHPKPLDFYDFEVDDGDFQKADDDYNEALEKYHSGLLPFECAMKIFPLHVRLTDIKPDTLIAVDLEAEVVEQKIAAHENSDKSWGPVVLEGHKLFQYRKVLRIKN